MSTESLLISIISGLLLIIQTLVGWIFRNTLNDLKGQISKVEARFEEYKADKDKFDYRFRHDEYASQMQLIETRMSMVERLPPRFEQLWDKVYDGERK